MPLPPALAAALDETMEEVPGRELTNAARALSSRYRGTETGAEGPLLRTEADVAAYLAFRMPATYAAVATVFEEVTRARPDFEPDSLLDVGGGPGTAAWAAAAVWPDLQRVTVVERDPRMLRAGRRLAERSDSPALQHADWREEDALHALDLPRADLAVAAYMLGELPAGARAAFVERLWEQTADIAVLIEPGTPRGYAAIREAIDTMYAAGAHIVAPFPHDWNCLTHSGDWCHFGVRLARTRLHRLIKDAALSFEDEKFSYVVASRAPGRPIAGRVIRRPQIHSGHVRLTVCTSEGAREIVVTRKNREAFRRARDLRWGAAIEIDEAAQLGIRV